MNREIELLTNRELEILRLIAEGSSDREIAQNLYLSVNTVKWHNRQIYAKLGVGSRTEALVVAAECNLLVEFPAHVDRIPITKKHNLPAQLSSFIGREAEIQRVTELLESTRLLTLTGPGGVGKTRLAQEVAARLITENGYPDGVFFIDLASLSSPEQMDDAVVDALDLMLQPGQKPREQLERYLEKKDLFLVMDNYEHLLKAATFVGELLSAAPKLKVLVTSREALNLSGEQVYPLSPLSLPDLLEESGSMPVREYESIELFIQRAKSVKPDFSPSDEDLQSVAQICTRLDGLPLAIELAAAQIKFFNIPSLLDQMETRFSVLKNGPRNFPERHQTLQSTIDWSYNLLSTEEQMLFNRLAVFHGSRTIDAAEKVCCEGLALEILDGLGSLLSKNLIRQEEGIDGELRFYMLETIHEYARERLIESGEFEELSRRHAKYFVELAESAKHSLRGGPENFLWLRRLEADHANFRVVFERATDRGENEIGLRLVSALYMFLEGNDHFDEWSRWTVWALEELTEAPPDIQAAIFASAGLLAYCYKDLEKSKKMLKKALAIYLELESPLDIGWAYRNMMLPSNLKPDERKELLEYFKTSMELFRLVDDKVGISSALTILGIHESISFNFSEAREAYLETLAISREIGDKVREYKSLLNLGCLLLDEGSPELALDRIMESLKISLDIEMRPSTNLMLVASLAGPITVLGQARKAIKLLGAVDNLNRKMGSFLLPEGEYDVLRYHASAKDQIDKKTYQQAWAEGQAMTYEEVIAYALNEEVVLD